MFVVNGTQVGVMLEPNGQATSFNIDNALTGTLTWHLHGDQFVMDQTVSNGFRVIYSALVAGDGSTLEGARVIWTGGSTGSADTFSANKS